MSDIDIKEKFGTGWIGHRSGSEVQSSSRSTSPNPWGDEPNAAFLTLGKQIIRFMLDSNGVDKLYSLADKMKLEPQDLGPVVEWLANNYYVRVELGQFGNHELRLTDKAKELSA
jgi:hypothetical protein